ncbi:hypothetical protein D9757_010552 [Collybiopsis confluens]|uniref:Uncharacterized protein n=1 Tax=Collybiopsis confluens TaxID=2823264 RepID=A0A8H5LXP8_9AGAR|nr:hypothetical protein D9757_010552 [Collybiopsis confluens]
MISSTVLLPGISSLGISQKMEERKLVMQHRLHRPQLHLGYSCPVPANYGPSSESSSKTSQGLVRSAQSNQDKQMHWFFTVDGRFFDFFSFLDRGSIRTAARFTGTQISVVRITLFEKPTVFLSLHSLFFSLSAIRMVANSAGNATFLINPVTYVERAIMPVEAILIISFALWGIYTVLFCTYVYFQVNFFNWSRKRPFLYPVSLVVLYILITFQSILSTLSLNRALTSNTMIQLTFNPSFLSSVASGQGPDSGYFDFLRLNFGAEVAYMTASFIADGILICRCYHLWGARMSVVAVPMVLYILNLGLSITGLVTEGTREMNFDPPFLLAPGLRKVELRLALSLSLAFAIGTVITNLLLTALIAGRIFWLTKISNDISDPERTSQAFSRLVMIILESGLLYAFALIIGVCLLPVITPVELLPITAQTMASVAHQIQSILSPHPFLVQRSRELRQH